MNMNPILRKELKLGARSIKFPFALMFYSGILSVGAILTLMSIVNGFNLEYYGTSLSDISNIFVMLAFGQLAMVCIIVPIMTGGSIAGERERQTLDLMLTTPISPFSLVMGKLWATMASIFLFVISSLPAMTLSFIYGGLEWKYLLVFLVEIMAVAFFNGALGIWCSATFKRTVLSVIMSLVMEVIFYGLTVAAVAGSYMMIYQQLLSKATINGVVTGNISTINLGWIPVVLLLNPAIGFGEAMMKAITGNGFMEGVLTSGTYIKFRVDSQLLEIVDYWVWINLAVTILLALIFCMLAARKIDAIRRKSKHVRLKKARKSKEKKK